MIRIRMDGSTRREGARAVVLAERFRYLFPRIKMVIVPVVRLGRAAAH